MVDCDHQHDQAHKTTTNRLLWALGVISVFMVVEVVGGVLSGSLALLADATHMLTDAVALALAVSAQFLAARPPDARLHYGYRRAQVLAAFVNGIDHFVVDMKARVSGLAPAERLPAFIASLLDDPEEVPPERGDAQRVVRCGGT